MPSPLDGYCRNHSLIYSKFEQKLGNLAAEAQLPPLTMLVLAWLFHSQALNPWLASPTRKTNNDITSIAINNGRVKCMHVWQPIGKKFETLSYLPNLDDAQLAKEVEYLLRNGWIPCLEFELEHGFVYREHNRSPRYYDGRY
ncbi:Ribulose bisphosphate carboxylase small chain 1, chloroplastic [Glycine max]|nr:Ribulose bisphosphate carboxylase small chain 1, chloroplastic [Glycine max]